MAAVGGATEGSAGVGLLWRGWQGDLSGHLQLAMQLVGVGGICGCGHTAGGRAGMPLLEGQLLCAWAGGDTAVVGTARAGCVVMPRLMPACSMV